MRRTFTLIAAAACACQSSDRPLELASTDGVTFDIRAARPPANYDPIALAASSVGRIRNVDANIPALCYTRSDGISNPCWTCHTHSEYPNLADDWELQQNYSFPPSARRNHWRNLFRDRRRLVDGFDDDAIARYVRTDNYAPLRQALERTRDFAGWRPDLDLAQGFDEHGFARDGSGWRTLRYKPFLGTFWATNGSADDVFIRLPPEFRTDAAGHDVYAANLAILEAAIASDPRRSDAELGLPAHYLGLASHVPVTRLLYPAGVEFLHSVRYLDPDAPAFAARRMKELRYARKLAVLDKRQLVAAYKALEAPDAAPGYDGGPLVGLRNPFGWQLQGWIEDARGWLRLQTHEEQTYCMGCHTGLGVTVDQTFAFARKVPGNDGWRLQDPSGIPDVPQIGHTEPEYALYLQRVRGGDELRANGELLARYFMNGAPDPARLASTRDDIGKLVLPSKERALALDRAYLANVIEQSFVWGRDAVVEPVRHVEQQIEERSTGIGEAGLTVRDGRLHLDWSRR